MGYKALIYKQKVSDNLNESFKHLKRLNTALTELEKDYKFPISNSDFEVIMKNVQQIAFSDQIIYRFSKLQDCMGAKLFKSILLFQGENINKPFLDILNQLEKMNVINVDEWFEMRDLRNSIAHDYESNENIDMSIINAIYKLKNNLTTILNRIKKL